MEFVHKTRDVADVIGMVLFVPVLGATIVYAMTKWMQERRNTPKQRKLRLIKDINKDF